MENNEFIESGLIFNLNSKVALRKFKYSPSESGVVFWLPLIQSSSFII